jgi:hypothetical protein
MHRTQSGHPDPDENLIDESIEETFPASDPPAWSGTNAGEPCRAEDKAKEQE